MRRLLLAALLLTACQDPFSFEPGNPTKPDPPGPPVLKWPADGELILNYAYPQNLTLEWHAIRGAGFYQVEVHTDSVPSQSTLHTVKPDVPDSSLTVRFSRWGFYYWRVRAASRNWNDYTAWSGLRRFILPNPGDRPHRNQRPSTAQRR